MYLKVCVILVFLTVIELNSVNANLCYQCNSKTDGVSCLEGENKMNATLCANSLSQCFIKIGDEGETIRGCTTEADNTPCNSQTNCYSCTSIKNGKGCNSFVYPDNRLRCHTCNDSNVTCSNELSPDASTLQLCPYYKEDDSCSIFKSGNQLVRGCKSSISQCTEFKCSNCKETGCNNVAAAGLPESIDFCAQCTSNGDQGANCRIGTDFPGSPCNGTNPSNNTCFIRIVEGGHIVRGCAGDLPIDVLSNCNSDNDCTTCVVASGTTCNTFRFPANRLLCHQCTGTTADACGGDVTEDAVICPLHIRDDQCFIRRENGTIRRGCVSSQPDCRGDGCYRCNENGCNKFTSNDDRVPEFSFAMTHGISTILLLSASFLAFYLARDLV